MEFRPSGDRVIIKVDEESDTTPSGIILPGESGKETLRYGTVVSVAASRYENGVQIMTEFNPGDRVCWARGNGSMLKIDGEELLCIGNYQIAGWIYE